MSSVAFPMPKPAGGRPPMGPPTTTAYDAKPGDEGDPIYRRLADSVVVVLNMAKAGPDELSLVGMQMILRLLEQRKRMVEVELSALRMMMPATLPPLLTNLYSLDYAFEDTEVERLYVRLLEEVDEASARLKRIIRERYE